MNDLFPKRLKSLRIEKDLTQEDLSKATGVSFPSISRYEKGRRDDPKRSILLAFSDFFDVSIDYLVGKCDVRDKDFTPNEMARIFNELTFEDRKILMDLAKSLLRKEGE
ncbi:MAG: helix-turn-helix transcriptional regulator [Dehalococcoidales bacterium]|nr:helix-turn-helix transcriptional regulator [Dehalococcoidales bacterium]